MIWHTEELSCPGKPDEATLTFYGEYNPPGSGKTVIILKLDIEQKPGDTLITKILMEKNPSVMRAVEEPSIDDIQGKYYRQVLNIRDKVMQTPYKDILTW